MVSVIYILMLDVSHAIEVLVLCLLVVGVKFHTAVAFLIRAKRVSNCYMREKKVCVCVCVYVRQIAKTRYTFACLHTYFLKTHAHRNCRQPNGGRSCCLMHGVAHG